jgi:hypothetical protein
MKIEKIKKLLKEAALHHRSNSRESTLFDIGMRGHFENPTTEVLAFFCDAKAEHKMGSLVVDSFLSLIFRKTNLSATYEENSLSQPQREVRTENNKRIDLLLSSDTWIMAIENKIYHKQVNPFEEYETFVNSIIKSDSSTEQQPLFVLLSPSGKVAEPDKHKIWCGISYSELIGEVKYRLKDHFYDQPFSKWVIILKDFLLHLENIMTKEKLNSEQDEFIFENVTGISKTWGLLLKSFSGLDRNFRSNLEEDPTIEHKIEVKNVSWFQKLPTYIYSIENSQFELALFMIECGDKFKQANHKKNDNKSIFIQIHIDKKEGSALHERVLSSFEEKLVNTWWKDDRLYIRWPAENLTTDGLLKDLSDSFIKLYQLEYVTEDPKNKAVVKEIYETQGSEE